MASVPAAAAAALPLERLDELDEQSDLGGLARSVGRFVGLPRQLAWVGCAALLAACAAALADASGWWVVAAAALLVVALGGALRPPLTGRLDWAVPSWLFAVEVAVVAMLQQAADPGHWAGAFAFCAAAAYRRYDVIYRRRDLGSAPPAWTRWTTLGVDGRLLLVAIAFALSPADLSTVLLVAAAVLGAMVLGESTFAWVRWLRRASDG